MVENLSQLKGALGLSVTVIGGEHLFSTFLSSPWTTQKFAETEEDKRIVRKLFKEAAVATIVFATVISWMLGWSIWPFLGAIAIIVMYYKIYEEALAGKL